MRDLVFVAYLLALFGLGLRRPFLFVLAYVYIDLVSPQRLTYLLLNAIPISLIAFIAAVGGWLIADRKNALTFGPRQMMILLLITYCFATTRGADFPVEAAFKWDWAWKAMIFAVFLPLTLNTRLRIEALLVFMALSISSIVIVGGIKTLVSGGGYGELNLMVSNNAGLYEGSTISMVAISIIPIIWWYVRYGTIFPPDWRTRLFCGALVFACLMIPIGTQTRTGLLCIGLLAVLMLREVRKPGRLIVLMLAGALVALPFLPSAFSERMSTIGTYQADASASTRIEVWKWTWNYAKTHPFGGGFDAYLQNEIRYDTVAQVNEGGQTVIKRVLQIDRARAYHSSYFEMLGEQGWPGLILWLTINLGGIFRMEVIRRRYRKNVADPWIAPLAGALQNAHLVYMLGAAFIGIAFQPFLFMLIGVQVALDGWTARHSRSLARRPIIRRRATQAAPA